MKVGVHQDEFSKALGLVGRVTSKRSTLPVLEHVLLRADGDLLRLSATDLNMSMSHWVPCRMEESGGITVPARLLSELVGQLPAEPIELSVNRKTMTLNIRAGRYVTNIKGMDESEFPIVPVEGRKEEGEEIVISTEAFRSAIGQVGYACALDESRPTLTGIFVVINDGKMTCAATDGFRLAVRSVGVERAGRKRELLIPRRSLAEVEKACDFAGDEGEVRITSDGVTQAIFEVGETVVSAALIDANYPNYRGIVPSSYGTLVEVDRVQLLQTLKMALLFGRDSSNIIRFDMEGDRMIVTADSAEVGNNTGRLDAVVKGDGLKIAFNGRYMRDALEALADQRVGLEMTSANKPCVLRPVGGSDGECFHLLMPMHFV